MNIRCKLGRIGRGTSSYNRFLRTLITEFLEMHSKIEMLMVLEFNGRCERLIAFGSKNQSMLAFSKPTKLDGLVELDLTAI